MRVHPRDGAGAVVETAGSWLVEPQQAQPDPERERTNPWGQPMAGPVEAGSWAPLRFHTGTPAWYRTGEWYRTGPDRQRRRGRGGDPTPWLFGTLGVPPPGPPRDLSEPHFLGQLRALKAEREILERELELALLGAEARFLRSTSQMRTTGRPEGLHPPHVGDLKCDNKSEHRVQFECL